MLPGYNHDHTTAVFNGRLYVVRDGVSHREVSLVHAQLELELVSFQVLQHFPLDEGPVVVTEKTGTLLSYSSSFHTNVII